MTGLNQATSQVTKIRVEERSQATAEGLISEASSDETPIKAGRMKTRTGKGKTR